MAKPTKRRVQGGRVTPKGTQPSGSVRPTSIAGTTPSHKVSAAWVPFVMFGLLIVGALMIILNYIDLLPGGTSNWYLLGGLALILGGIVTATQYH